ncbi:hypothetical protein N0V82_006806 [Gnomoniopsis sp. IMI 355080]|nr:hypothetical protein N0V82_006806 [Gnomoniopsis sp. IMI 355080]
MSDKEESAPVAAPAAPAAEADTAKTETAPAAPAEESKEAAKPVEPEPAKEEVAKPAEESTEKPSETEPTKDEDADVDMKDAPETSAPAETAVKDGNAGDAETAAPAAATSKAKAPARRKSTAAADKGKTLNKKGSKAQILHIDAKPGDHYFIKLKGFPQWPCIICDEDMLPHALLKSRPVSAARADGEYREDYADGGKNVANRTFPIMYLATNEFGWVSNKDLIDLKPETVMEQVTAKMRKDLVLAHQLAEENHDLDYYKGVLQKFQEELLEKQKAAEAKAAAAATPKSSKKKGKAVSDDDVDMEDVDDDEAGAKKDKKRKNTDDSETPQRSDSVKKPKIKLTHNSTPKSNGASSKAKAGSDAKSSSKKAKKPKEDAEEQTQDPKEPELSPEDKYERKKKEVLFLRHKLQKGLLTRDQQPKEEEMKMMSDYLTKLEGFPDLETEIIRTTKINKVLKAMLKLDHIPKEEEFHFKPRSQVLLEKWNKLLATDEIPTSPNGVNGLKGEKTPAKEEAKSETNGVKKTDTEGAKAKSEEPKTEVSEADESKDTPKKEESSLNEEVAAKKEAASSTEEKPKVDEDTKMTDAVDAAA